MRRRGYQLTSYADDRVITCESAAQARAALAAAQQILEKLGVELNREKTRIEHVRHGFEFLGYKIKRGRRLRAAMAQCAGSLPRFAAWARGDAAFCVDATRRLVRRGAADDAHGLVEAYFVALWVCDAVGSCGREVKPPGSTAGYGKPLVRWCGRVPGRNPRHPTRSSGAKFVGCRGEAMLFPDTG